MARNTRVEQSDIAGVIAASDLSAAAKQYTLVVLDATGKEADTAGADAVVAGVQINKPAADEAVDIMCYGTVPVRVDGNAAAIAPMDRLETDANGYGVKSTVTKHNSFGIALEPSTAAGDVIAVLFDREVLNV